MLSAQFDGSREEPVHRDQDRHLKQQGQTTGQGVHTRFGVQVHDGLLLFGRIGIGILLVMASISGLSKRILAEDL